MELPEHQGHEVIRCHQGLWSRCTKWLREHGYDFELHDRRHAFPLPKFEHTHGFRFGQQALLFNAVMQGCSGMIVAPTRYGKTYLILNLCRMFPRCRTVVAVPGKDLVRQTWNDLKKHLPKREVKMIGGGRGSARYPSEDITVCSMDSLHRVDPEAVQLLAVDEPHTIATDKRAVSIAAFRNARKFAFGATPEGRYDGRDMIVEALIGPVLAEKTYAEAVAEGAILPLVAILLHTSYGDPGVQTRNACYRHLVWENRKIGEKIQRLSREVFPPNWQTLIFIENERQAEFVADLLPEAEIAMDKRLTQKAREDMFDRMANNQLMRCLSSEIMSTGVTFPDLRAIIMASGGGGSIKAIQKPGRLAQAMPGKTHGYVVDLFMEPDYGYKPANGADMVFVDSLQRRRAYTKKGYEIEDAHSIEDVAEIIQKYEQLGQAQAT